MKPSPLHALAVTLAALLPLTACSNGSGSDSEQPEELVVGMPVDLTTWAAADAAWGNEALYHQAVYDTLLRTDAQGGVEPGLATEWSYDESMTRLTLELREGVTFSDGTAFDAEVAVQNLLRFRDGASENAANLSSVVEAEAVDADTVELTLDAPDPALLTYLSHNAGLQASPETFDAEDAQVRPVGSGPYVLDEEATVVSSRYVFTAREDYWDPEVQLYPKITMQYYPDATAMLNAVKGGQVNVTNLHSSSQAADAESAGYDVHLSPVNWKGLILADRGGEVEEAVGDVRVRQAINHALDREALLDAMDHGYGEPTAQIFGPDSEAYAEALDDAYPYDPDRARELLEEAGYPDGITLVQPQTSFTPASEFELIAGMLAESGIDVEAEHVGSTFIGDLLGGAWPTFRFALNQEPLPWMTYRLAIAPDSAWNVYDVEDPTVEKLAERMRLGGEDGAAASRELNEYLVEQAWFAPFYRLQGIVVTDGSTDATHKVGYAMPNLWDIVPVS
ncbi:MULTISPECIES: ABC transporter substrate-binding protein [unclassified Nocardiopsis]|uniref:ABC transporter substrate-binding protein n=1 Tax=unclassified Nocardiopsis TaxID=2649073 RepID=UPI00135C9018|nr:MULTISPECIES: ABC transporter substrate-binding protein [unclassified Nocardiopsis]